MTASVTQPPDARYANLKELLVKPVSVNDLLTAIKKIHKNGTGPAQAVQADQPAIVTVITSPASGAVVASGTRFPVIGTAQFGPDQALHYKVEVSGGQFNDNWVMMGATHNSPVVNGELERLGDLAPGSYQVRLVVIARNGNVAQPPYVVPFRVQ
jgi:hypothetical protein